VSPETRLRLSCSPSSRFRPHGSAASIDDGTSDKINTDSFKKTIARAIRTGLARCAIVKKSSAFVLALLLATRRRAGPIVL
jgi:hypothetical protein